MNLIDQLVDAAYATGYYSGKKEDGQPHHTTAILLREKLRHEVLDLTRKPAPEVKALVDAATAAAGYMLDADLCNADREYMLGDGLRSALAPFKVPE